MRNRTPLADTPNYVLDATVATKWHLSDEEHVDRARQVRLDFEADRIGLVAPTQLQFEVAAAILKATRHPERPQRLAPQIGGRALEVFQSWNIRYVPGEPLVARAYRLAIQYGCSYYDAIYVALAQATGIPLLHADSKLRRALGNRFPLAVWIEDYRSP